MPCGQQRVRRMEPWLTLLLVLCSALVTPSQQQPCDAGLGMESGRITRQQLKASSVKNGLSVDYARFNCCSDIDYGAWCPSNATSEEWFEINLYRPANVTAVMLQRPSTKNESINNYVTKFNIQVELSTSRPGVLTTYEDPATKASEFEANFTDSSTWSLAITSTAVRRIRIVIVDFHNEPCFRIELAGCQIEDTVPASALTTPTLYLDYTSLDMMYLVCDIKDDISFSIQYKVTWYQDDKDIAQQLLANGELQHKLSVEANNFTQKQTHVCKVQACYTPDCDVRLSDQLPSDVYRPQMKRLSGATLSLTEGGTDGQINVTFNAPPNLLCLIGNKKPDCNVFVVATVTDEQPLKCTSPEDSHIPQIVFPKESDQSAGCATPITMADWQTTHHVRVRANRDMLTDGTRSSVITLLTYVGDVTYEESQNEVKVDTADSDRKSVCQSLNDPHLKTFDNKYYDNHREGEFVFYRHKQLPFEVRTFYKHCVTGGTQTPSCNCATAVRSGDDVIVFRGCRPGEGISVEMFLNGELEKGTRVLRYKGGQEYKVILPSGAILVIRASYTDFMNVWFYPSPLDFNNTEGLCGNFDDDAANDVQDPATSFSLSWRVNDTDSIYNGWCPGVDVPRVPLSTDCACLSAERLQCSPGLGSHTCHLYSAYHNDNDVTSLLKQNARHPLNCFRAVTAVDEFVYDHTAEAPSLPVNYPEPWTDENARNYCEQELQSSPLATICENVTQVQVEEKILDCMNDIRWTNDSRWSRALVDSLEEACLYELAYNTRWQVERTMAIQQICPNFCSGNGKCVTAVCICDEPFIGVDCSVDSRSAPVITRVADNGLCNLLISQCRTVVVYGHTFVKSRQLRCYYRRINVSESGYSKVSEWEEAVSTVFVSDSRVECELPAAGYYIVSVENTLLTRSASVLYIAHDPVCYNCDAKHGNCTQKDDTCVIDGKCWTHLQVNPDNFSQICSASQNKTSWSPRISPCLRSQVKWQTNSSSAIAFHNHKSTTGVSSIADCRSLCLQEAEFMCQSIDYNSGTDVCHLSKYRQTHVGQYFLSFANTFTHEEWSCEKDPCAGHLMRWDVDEAAVTENNNDVVTDNVWRADVCRTLCLARLSCRSVKFQPARGICVQSDGSKDDDNIGWVKAPGWQYHERTCVDGSPSDRLGPAVDKASLVAMFRAPGNDSFKCEFSPLPDTTRPIRYDVLWSVDGVWTYEDTLDDNVTEEYLNANLANAVKDGSTVRCAVSACYATNCEETRGILALSQEYKAQLKLENVNSADKLLLREGEGGVTMPIYATAPPYVLCRDIGLTSPDSCEIQVVVEIGNSTDPIHCPNGDVIEQVSVRITQDGRENKLCKITVTSDTWTSRFNINLRANIDNKYDTDHTTEITLAKEYLVDVAVQKTVEILKSEVTIVNVDTPSICMSVNDPHMTTFDGVYYHNYFEGEFIMYRHKILPYEIRTFYRSCSGRASCNCAVAARAGDDVVIIDKCGPSAVNTQGFYPITVKLFRNGVLTPGFRVFSQFEGTEYQIIFPSGLIVYVSRSVIRGYDFLNVWIAPSTSDYNQTEGLCGNFDGDQKNDFIQSDGTLYEYPAGIANTGFANQPNNFSKSWRVTDDTLYTGYCSEDSTSDDRQLTYCLCQSGGRDTCAEGRHLSMCDIDTIGSEITDRLVTSSLIAIKCKRNSLVSFSHPRFEYDINREPREYGWPTTSGTSEILSRGLCSLTVEGSLAYKVCKDVPDIHLTNAIESCVQDVKITEDMNWGKSAVENVRMQCQIHLNRNLTLWVTDPSDTFSKLPDAITNSLCVAECGGFAKACKNGTCDCGPKASGSDCFVRTDESPNLFYLGNSGLCDLRKDSCSVVTVFNNNTINTNSLSCVFTKVQINETGLVKAGDPIIKEANFVSINELTCVLPSVDSYEVQIFNTKDIVSSSALYLVYNSLCEHCFINNQTCVQRDTGCRIDGQCYEEGEYNPTNSRQFCDPKKNRTSWQSSSDSCQTLDLVWLKQINAYLASFEKETLKSNSNYTDCRDQCLAKFGDPYVCESFNVNSSSQVCTLSTANKRSGAGNMITSTNTEYHEWMCDNDPCDKRGISWTVRPGFAILGHNKRDISDISSATRCRHLCLRETSFLCRSFEFLLQARLCSLSDVAQAHVGNNFVQWPGYMYQEWSCNTGADLPIISRNPVASISQDGSGEFTLQCSFPTLMIVNTTILYNVDWLVNNNIVDYENGVQFQDDMAAAHMDRSLLNSLEYGTSISCGVSACVQSECNKSVGAFRRSNLLKLVVKVVGEEKITLNEGMPGREFQIASSFPPSFLCQAGWTSCSVSVRWELAAADGDLRCGDGRVANQLVFGGKPPLDDACCDVTFTDINWRESRSVRVIAKRDSLVDGDHTRLVHFKYRVTSDNSTTPALTTVQSFNLSVIDGDRRAVCKSVGDPHITTFDGRYYNNFYEGEFVLYRHKTLSYEVRSFYRSCRGKASCNCAVSVKSGDDVIVIDRCGPRATSTKKIPLMVKLYKKGELTPGTRIRRMAGGLKYKIFLPTGTVVTVRVDRSLTNYLNIWIKPSSTDFNNTEGLCGNFDSKEDNDFVKSDGSLHVGTGLEPGPFLLSWRVLLTDSLYTGQCVTDDAASADYVGLFCDCQAGASSTCQYALDSVPCPSNGTSVTDTDITSDLVKYAEAVPKCSDVHSEIIFEYNMQYVPKVYGWPTPNNMTEEEANSQCLTKLNSSVTLECMNVIGEQFEHIFKSCVRDLQIMDDLMWIQTALVDLFEVCLVELKSNVKLWATIDGKLQPNLAVLDSVCTEHCFLLEPCSCSCSAGEGGADCSVKLDDPPEVFHLYNNLCDLETSTCDEIIVFGETFVNSENLYCKLQPIQIEEDGFTTFGDAVTVTAEFFSFNQLMCRASTPGSYSVSVSNNKNNYSVKRIFFTAYSPGCHQCTTSGRCTLTPDTCFIDNKCYLYGDKSPDNETLVCDIYQDYRQWSIFNAYPYLTGEPKISVRLNEMTNEFFFVCEFDVSQRDDVQYSFSWYHNDSKLSEMPVEQPGNTTEVNINTITGIAYASRVTCGISACFTTNCSTTMSPAKKSKQFTVELKVSTDLTLMEGGMSVEFEVELTVPSRYMCVDHGDDCRVHVGLVLEVKDEHTCPSSNLTHYQSVFVSPPSQPGEASCSLGFTTWPQVVKLPVKAVSDMLVDGDQVRSVHFSLSISKQDSVQFNSVVSKRSVTIKDSDRTSLCSSVNDPHMKTFDGRKYNNFLEGEFVLYRHKTLPYEVRSFYRACNGRASCNCAVTVKSGDDVILIDRCGPTMGTSTRKTRIAVKIFKNGQLTKHTRILQFAGGKRYEVHLPTGTYVIVRNGVSRTANFLNVWVKTSAADFQQTEGLCGSLDDDKTNDFFITDEQAQDAKTFSLHWRVSADTSHYSGVCVDEELPASTQLFCKCQSSDQPECGSDLDVIRCSDQSQSKKFTSGVDYTEHYLKKAMPPHGCKGSDLQQIVFQYDAEYRSQVFTWPTQNLGYTEQQARAYCRGYILNTTIGARCMNLLSLQLEISIASCVSDIQIMDSLDWAQEALQGFILQCLSLFTFDVTMWVNIGGVPRPDFHVIELVCSNGCSNQGKCVAGVCMCDEGFLSPDCSVDASQPPAIEYIANARCDRKTSDCSSVVIFGDTFIRSDNLKCRLTKAVYSATFSYTKSNDVITTSATFVSFQQVVCPLTAVGSYYIEVTIEGTLFSQAHFYEVVDSSCITCNNETCSINEARCFIDSTCYKFGKSPQGNDTLVCDPNRNSTVWTDRTQFPAVGVEPQLSVEFNESTLELTLVCDWSDYVVDPSVQISVLWFTGDNVTSESTVTDNTTRSDKKLSSDWAVKYGDTIFCALQACRVGSCTETKSPYVKSNEYKLEIQVIGKTSLTVTEGADAKIVRIKSTFPPVVFCNHSSNCTLHIDTFIPEVDSDITCPGTGSYIPQAVISWRDNQGVMSSCGVTLTNENWQSEQLIYVQATVDGRHDNNQRRTLEISAQVEYSGTLLVQETVSVATVTLLIKDTNWHAVCKSINDPHMTTFDGRYYNNFNVGEFVLYRHTTLPYEIHTFYRSCNGKASCNCAVAVRVDDDVVVVDRCGPSMGESTRSTPISVRMYIKGELSSGLRVIRINGGKKYAVILPTGSTLTVSVGRGKTKNFMNVWFKASAVDYAHTEGLCGTFDGNKNNDLQTRDVHEIVGGIYPNKFSLSWRVGREDSLYSGLCHTTTTTSNSIASQLCSCRDKLNMECDSGYAYTCQQNFKKIRRGTDITEELKLTAIINPIQCVLFEYDVNYIPEVFVWPTPSGWTWKRALEFCTDYIQGRDSGRVCTSKVKSIELEPVITACVEDIQIMDDISFASAALENVKEQCLFEVEVNIKFWVRLHGRFTIDINIIGSMCDDECNDHGSCRDGVCDCHEGYAGPDCSINLSAPPSVEAIREGGWCDLSAGACSTWVYIYGENFYESASLTCYFKSIQIQSVLIISNETIQAAAVFINFNTVRCNLPAVGSYAISISNVENIISVYTNYIVYNSVCVTCNSEGMCMFKPDTCFIDGKCYKIGELKPNDASQACLPSVIVTAWADHQEYPILKAPKISKEETEDSPYFVAACQFERVVGADIRYTVEWFAGEEHVTDRGPFKDETKSILNAEMLTNFTVGQKIQCALVGCYRRNCTGTTSPPVHSKHLLAEIQVTETELKMKEGSDVVDVGVKLTFPPGFFCHNLTAWDECHIKLELVVIETESQLKCQGDPVVQAVVGYMSGSGQPKCGIVFTAVNWKTELMIAVKAKTDSPLVDGDREANLKISSSVTMSENMLIITTAQIIQVKLTVLDSDRSATCKSVNDPHITTFDGRKYNNFYEGEFIFYKHTTKPYEVRTFYRSCRKKASCNCAVAVRSGDDVIVIDRCAAQDSDPDTQMVVRTYITGELTPGTRIVRYVGGREYRVYLPTGTYVVVKNGVRRTREFINVWIHASAADWGHTQGLCGTYDGNAKNDFLMESGKLSLETGKMPNVFSRSWRVTADSLYDGFCASDHKADLTSAMQYCECEEGREPVCGADLDIFTCGIQKTSSRKINSGLDQTDFYVANSRTPRKCSVREKTDFMFKYNINYVQTEVTWPTLSGINETQARNICMAFIRQTDIHAQCNQVERINLHLEETVDFCVDDIKITDDTQWTMAALDSFTVQCLSEISRRVDLWVTVGGETTPPAAVVNVICSNDCSGNGRCSQGECICNNNWIGEDCSVNATQPPVLSRIQAGDLCDVRVNKHCRRLILIGSSFVESTAAVCHITEISVGNRFDGNATYTVNTTYISSDVVVCELRSDSSINISVSNDGTLVSETQTYIIYNSACVICTSQGCSSRTDICTIGGSCFACGSVFVDDPSKFCDTSKNKTEWTAIKTTQAVVHRFKFLSLEGGKLKTPLSDLDVMGTPKLEDGNGGGYAISLNTDNDRVDFTSEGVLSMLDNCSVGFSFKFYVKYLSFCNNMYVLTTGGDLEDSSGVAIYYFRRSIHVTVSTPHSIWTLATPLPKIQRFHDYRISWSETLGLDVEVDGTMVAMTKSFYTRIVPGTNTHPLVIGGPIDKVGGCTRHIVFGGLEIFTAPTLVLTTLNVITELPVLTDPPVLSVSLDIDTNEVVFKCSFLPLDQGNVAYHLEWFIDDVSKRVQSVAGGEMFNLFNESEHTDWKYGTLVRCTVTPCYSL
ncbi:uncharacterized protein LOC121382945 isoform X2 [Gigantopelta aegis]|uniref:uncharacterized protein LOC121382945 isoform X2 n=1 Tax=Gigantopelta aegis TaxID=1735272 RepID=UPI001B88ADC1|nr:uncharacterized protein LOC121382945 isoform X2 [Gigantopelta aegis]